ncbi:uncharacterized protein LOC134181438 isoform X2 [Corticium candelabrum]|uniref:uncharacterized protein LOC134181438 isoform X2 n=1 Tax=Corticium candelabrum TaxID=121492 RepID=UPI002E25C230|nr:uncharacterized protein LOC134181438 isoform X2 [Corticium candelabrum]
MRQLSQISDFLEAGEFSQNVIDNWKQFFEAFEDELEMQPQRYSAVKDAENSNSTAAACNMDDESKEQTINEQAGNVDAHTGMDSVRRKATKSAERVAGKDDFVDLVESEDRSEREIQFDSDSVKDKIVVTSPQSAEQDMDKRQISNGTQLETNSVVTHSDQTCSSQETDHNYRNDTTVVLDEVDQVVSDHQLQLLSVEIASMWRNVARCLKPEPMHGQILDDIAIQYSHSLQEQTIVMLDMWRDKYGSIASIKTLCEVLINADKRIAAEKVFGGKAVQQVYLQMKETDSEEPALLYHLAEEVGSDWKAVAVGMGLKLQQIKIIELEAHIPREQAWTMLCLLHSKMGSDFSINEVHRHLQQIRNKRQADDSKNQIFPQNIRDDIRLCGRKAELDTIAETFLGKNVEEQKGKEIPNFCVQVINGLGGCGKSHLSEKYAVLYKEMYSDGIFYFNAESLASLHLSIRKNLCQLSMESRGGGVFEDNDIFLQYLYHKSRVLLLYDGADKLNVLDKILPRVTAHVHVLVTTRVSGDHPLLLTAENVTTLSCLEAAAAVEALQVWRGHADEELLGEEAIYAKRLVIEDPIDGLPLAIAHAGTFMRKRNVGCQQYYQLIRTQQAHLEALALDMNKLLHYFHISNLQESLQQYNVFEPKELSKLTDESIQLMTTKQHERRLLCMARYFMMNSKHMHLTWQLDIETVKETDANAMVLLSYASLMACRNIPEFILQPLVFGSLHRYHYSQCINTLTSHSLVDVCDGNKGYNFSLHPLVHSTILERFLCQSELLRDRITNLCHSLLCFLPLRDSHIMSSLKDDQFISLVPHVYAVAEKAVWFSDETCVTLMDLACLISLVAQHVDVAVHLCKERLKASGMNPNIRQRVMALYYMAQAYLLMSQPQAAQHYLISAAQLIESCEEYERKRLKHEYCLVVGQLGECYQDQQMFTEAESLYQTQLSLLYDMPGDNTEAVAAVIHNLALSYCMSGKLEQAIEAFDQVLRMMTADSPNQLLRLSTALKNQGWCLMANAQYRKAFPLLERSLAIRREHLPADHHDVAQALHCLSECCLHLGNTRKAVQLCEESLSVVSQCLPANHPQIATYMTQLSSCHQSAGNLNEAIDILQRSIVIDKQHLPHTRISLCPSLNNLGLCYRDKGMLDAAIRTFEECLEIQRSFLPEHHPDIGTTLWNLGLAYKKINNIVKASRVWRECLAIREKTFSPTHTCVIDVLMSLASITYDQEHYEESLQMHRRLWDLLMRTSPVSENMAKVCHNMGTCYAMLYQFDAAEKAISQSLQIQISLYLPGDDRISTTEQELHQLRQLQYGD